MKHRHKGSRKIRCESKQVKRHPHENKWSSGTGLLFEKANFIKRHVTVFNSNAAEIVENRSMYQLAIWPVSFPTFAARSAHCWENSISLTENDLILSIFSQNSRAKPCTVFCYSNESREGGSRDRVNHWDGTSYGI